MNRAAVFCLVANLIGGTTYVAMKLAAEVPPLTIAFLRSLVALPLLWLVAAATGRARAPWTARDRLLLLVIAVPGYAFPLFLGQLGTTLSTAGFASILILVEPISVVPLALLFLREPVQRRSLVAVLLGLCGAVLVVASGVSLDTSTARAPLLGNVLLALSGVMWAVYTVACKPLLRRHDSLMISAHALWVALLPMAVLLPLEIPWLRPAFLDPFAASLSLQQLKSVSSPLPALCGVLYLSVFGSFLGVWLWNVGLSGVHAHQMAGFIFLQPLVGLFLDYLFFGQVPGWITLPGAVLIALAIVTLCRMESTAEAATPGPLELQAEPD